MDKRKKFLHITALGDQRIEEAFSTPKTSVWSVNEALKKSNLYKNRYSNVFPYDKTRVRLPVEKGSEDYINASYVTLDQNEYIAAQGPLTDTIHHFWAMAYNESEKQNNDTVVIAMVTPLTESGIVKCTQYWPDKTQISFDLSENILEDRISIPGGSLKVEYVQESYNAVGDYLLTELLLKSDTKVKKWADAKVPPSLSPLCQAKWKIKKREYKGQRQSFTARQELGEPEPSLPLTIYSMTILWKRLTKTLKKTQFSKLFYD
ncbi:hypothetical protein QCA50_012276 [Cerrena zonata]|uniref:Tyrosine-protein phosphatase domain-containing protein n=1 Tax=Cerrena zonata TaxID=2478898 RepID=A0AAW0G415_9APHY